MNYSVKFIVVFEKQAKRLVKKHASGKNELLHLVNELKENPKQGKLLAGVVIKSVFLLPLKGKVSLAVRG